MERYPTLKSSDSWRLVHKPRLETSSCNYTQQQLHLFAVSERAMGSVRLVAQVSVVIVSPGRNSELRSSPSWLLCLCWGHHLRYLPVSSDWCQMLSLEVATCCCHRPITGVQQHSCSNLAVEVCSAPNKFSLTGFLPPLQKPVFPWKYPGEHFSRPSERLAVVMQCMAFSSWMLSGN